MFTWPEPRLGQGPGEMSRFYGTEEAFTWTREEDMLSPIVLVLVPVDVSVLVPLSVNTPWNRNELRARLDQASNLRWRWWYCSHWKQECIPVGCVPPACCPYLPAWTASVGVGIPGLGGVLGPGGCTWSWGVSLVQGLYLVPGGGGTCPSTPPVYRHV